MENEFDDFIKNILDIEKQLNILDAKSNDLVNNLINKIENIQFIDKNNIITEYEDLMTAITHETGSQIGLYRENIIKLNKYINFRIKYNNFCDEILGKIIDNELTLTEKNKLCDGNKAREILDIINEIKQNWNEPPQGKPCGIF